MERVDKVMNHPVFRENMERIEKAEIDRFFCRHGLPHALDVARIFYILLLEEQVSCDKKLVDNDNEQMSVNMELENGNSEVLPIDKEFVNGDSEMLPIDRELMNGDRGMLPLDKELVYATALLHDIGRYEQYENGTPHNEAGAKLAGEIMASCGFTEDECARAVNAIKGHRRDSSDGDVFCHLLYKADKLSRDCYRCEAEPECYWDAEQKNMRVKY